MNLIGKTTSFLLLFIGLCMSVHGQTWGNVFTVYNSANSGLVADSVTQVGISPNGKKWFSSEAIFQGSGSFSYYPDSGVSSFNGTTWNTPNHFEIGVPYSPAALAVEGNSTLWISSWKGLTSFDGQNWQIYHAIDHPYLKWGNFAVEVDGNGNKWIANQLNLVKFDGTNWTTYQPTWSLGIVHDMDIDGSGTVWMASSSGGLYKFDGSNWTRYITSNSGIPSNSVNSVSSYGGNIWVGTNSGLAKFDGVNWTIYTTGNSSIPGNQIGTMDIDASGNIWFGISNLGLGKFDGTTFTHFQGVSSQLSTNNIGRIRCNGLRVLISTQNEAASLVNSTTWTIYNTVNSGLASNHVLDFIENSAGNQFFLNPEALNRFTTSWRTWHYKTSNWFSMRVNDFGFDNSGNVWMPTFFGLGKYDGNTFTTENLDTTSFIKNLKEHTGAAGDNSGNMWVTTGGRGLFKWDGNTWTNYTSANSGLPMDSLTGLEFDGTGKLWIMTGGSGVCSFDGTNWTTFNIGNSGIHANDVVDLSAGPGNALWFAHKSPAALSRFDGTNWQVFNSGSITTFPINSILCVEAAPNGDIWMGTLYGGLYQWNQGTVVNHYTSSNSNLPRDWVNDIESEPNGSIWIGTSLGVAAMQAPAPTLSLGADTSVCDSLILRPNQGPWVNYQWVGGSTTDSLIADTSGWYWVTVTDTGSNQLTDSIFVTVFNSLAGISVDLGPDTNLCGSTSLVLDAGTAGVQYLWDPGAQTSQTITASNTGWYSVAVLDACGNADLDSIFVTFGNLLIVSLGPDTVVCGDTLYLTADTTGSGNAPITFTWSPSGSGPVNPVTQSGQYVVTVTNPGCSASDTVSVVLDTACVWPGDANYDLIANNVDVLSIGVAFGTAGAVRPLGTTAWTGQACPDWGSNFASGPNYKHADCDGNGLVGNPDMNVITLNYGQTHNKTDGVTQGGPNDPLLYFLGLPDSSQAGDTVMVTVALGTDTVPTDSIYGIAFTFNFDTTLVDSGYAFMDYSNSWIGNQGSNLLTYSNDFYNQGKTDFAIVRNDQNQVSGYGAICKLGLVMQDDIAGKKAFLAKKLGLFFTDVTLIRLDESVVPVNQDTGSVVIWQAGNGVSPKPEMGQLEVFPNPGKGLVSLRLQGGRLDAYTLFDPMGRKLKSANLGGGGQVRLDFSDLKSGVYLLQVEGSNVIHSRKLIVQRD